MSGNWVPAFILIIPVLCAILARYGFTGREHVVGIDLGTTYSVIGVQRQGKVVIMSDKNGRVLLPSVVSFLKNGKKLVGYSAREHMKIDPKHSIFNAKRFIGRSNEDKKLKSEASLYDYKVETDYNIRSEPCFKLSLSGHPSCVSPIEVGSDIVRKLKEISTSFLGHDQITTVVMAVPADFNDRQRRATAAVFKSAGLKILRMLDEPTAAAIAYGLHRNPSVNFVLVFDFGGGTLDVSLLYVQDGSVEVVDTAGDSHLGGEDIDDLLSSVLMKKFQKLIGSLDLHVPSNPSLPAERLFPCTSSGIRMVAEKLKRELSTHMHSKASCIVQYDGTYLKAGTVAEVIVSRQEFEKLCVHLINRVLVPVHHILHQNSMKPKDVDEIVLVGGSSRIPWVKEKLQSIFDGKNLNFHIDPDIAVAYGASMVE